MARYIDADKLARELAIELEKTKVPRKNEKSNISYLLNLNKIYYALFVLSVTEAEDVAPVVHAHWKKKSFNYANPTNTEAVYFVNYVCSKCDTTWKYSSHYCPNCGAKMDEEVES